MQVNDHNKNFQHFLNEHRYTTTNNQTNRIVDIKSNPQTPHKIHHPGPTPPSSLILNFSKNILFPALICGGLLITYKSYTNKHPISNRQHHLQKNVNYNNLNDEFYRDSSPYAGLHHNPTNHQRVSRYVSQPQIPTTKSQTNSNIQQNNENQVKTIEGQLFN